MSVLKQASRSVFWSAVERFSVQGAQYLLGIVIARLLLPSDYGLIAMLSIFLAISQSFIDSGFGNALIQKQGRTEVDYSTVFYFNIGVSVCCYGLLYWASPYIAEFYNEPKLDLVTKVVGLSLILNSFGMVQQTKLTIALNFKLQAIASLVAVLISGGVGIWLAYAGYGVWALVWHTLLNNLLRVILLWFLTKWKPLVAFSMDSFRGLFAFGSKLLLSNLLHTIYVNLYTLVIGKKFAAADLGFFNRASSLAQFPSSNFSNVIVRAIYPIQCAIQDDSEQLNRMFLSYLRMACYLIFPIMVLLCALANPLIEWLLTDKWLPAAPLFQILCIAYMWDPVMKINHTMLNVKGRSDYFLRAEVVKKSVAVVILLVTIPFGIWVMCMGLVLYALADMFVISYFTHKITQITRWCQIKALTPVTLLAASMGGVAFGVSQLLPTPFLKLLGGSLAALIYYIGVSKLLGLSEFRQLISLADRKRGKRV